MKTTEIPITQLSSADYSHLKSLGDLKPQELRSAVYNSVGSGNGRKGGWTLDKIKQSWTRGEMIAHLFNEYLKMKPTGS